jgi:S-adenosylmethionine-diacylgycerolhomoserine-N-methlytransferase
MSPPDFAADARILWRLLRGQPRACSHAERLQGFYAPQADRYDAFRERLLHGRADLIKALDIPPGAHVVELGCGTGSNLELLRGRRGNLSNFTAIQMVDLCPALLTLARQRAQGQANVEVIEADATTWRSQQAPERIFMSYSLSMIPDWQAALHNAWDMLAPGGRLGIVDFHLPRNNARISNLFWKKWFAHDGVHLSDQYLPALQGLSANSYIQQRRAPVPYLPMLRAPYFLFIGHKPHTPCTAATID